MFEICRVDLAILLFYYKLVYWFGIVPGSALSLNLNKSILNKPSELIKYLLWEALTPIVAPAILPTLDSLRLVLLYYVFKTHSQLFHFY